ncbi:hypothetical protein COLO4_13555 [Corchorus olitorius]|uniref:Uncharacterized protein n=1 Tax=Corchorus olitorius TaxID=93759 RepID=A0A1R3JW11_9ROSI|nr:hypothetical protein COLO4_13555 [Corchorus olitorius]
MDQAITKSTSYSFERLRLRAEVAADLLTHVTNPKQQSSDSRGLV